jgi:hypothetical protein
MEAVARISACYDLCHSGATRLAAQLQAGVEWRPTLTELLEDMQELGNAVDELQDLSNRAEKLMQHLPGVESARTSTSSSPAIAAADVCLIGSLPD